MNYIWRWILFLTFAAETGAQQSTLIGRDTAADAPSPIPAVEQMIFDEEFDGTTLNLTKWHRCYPYAVDKVGCTNGPPLELEWYSKDNDSVSKGRLRITARKQHLHGYDYTSGMIVTGGSPTQPPGFTFLYGYMEMSAKLPPGAGMWPAFWLLPADGSWPPEIDAMEWQGGTPTIDYATIHWGKQVNGQHPQSGTAYDSQVDLAAGFHSYGLDWQADSVTWYFDGKPVKKFTRASVIPHKPMYILIDLAVGGWISFPDANTHFPAVMQVDYVRVWPHKP
jgi:beta-glucanase (GH16 family)